MMVIIRPGSTHVIQLRILLLKRIQMELVLGINKIRDPSLVSESIAWVSHKRSTRAWHSMMVIIRPGLTHVTQLKIPLLKRIQVVLEPIMKRPKEPSQVLVLNAWASLRDTLTLMFSMMATNRTGLTNAMEHKIHGPKRTQAELELMKTNIRDLSQVLELSAKDSLR